MNNIYNECILQKYKDCLNKAHKLINPARLEESTIGDFLLQLKDFVEEAKAKSEMVLLLERRVEELENGFHAIYEEYAGMDGCISETVVEGYYFRIIRVMASIAARYKPKRP